MLKYPKTLLALVGTAIVLGALVGSASAGRLSTSTRNIRVTWPSVEFIEPVFGYTNRCPITFEGSLHSATVAKSIGALIGHMSRATVNNNACSAVRATILQASLPWHVHYGGFLGSLPSISSVIMRVIAFEFRADGWWGDCLFTTTEAQAATLNYNRTTATGAVASVTMGGSITSSEGCEPFGERINIRLGGTSGAPTVLGGTAAITVTLI